MPRPDIRLPGYGRRGSLGVRGDVSCDSAALKSSDTVWGRLRVPDDAGVGRRDRKDGVVSRLSPPSRPSRKRRNRICGVTPSKALQAGWWPEPGVSNSPFIGRIARMEGI